MLVSDVTVPPAELIGDSNQFLLSLSVLEDPRINRKKWHPLMNILVIALIAVSSGVQSWDQIAYYGLLHQKKARKKFGTIFAA